MDPNQDLSVIFGTSHQSIVDKILHDASTMPFDASVPIPSRTTICKGYAKAQHKLQKKPFNRIPRSLLEK